MWWKIQCAYYHEFGIGDIQYYILLKRCFDLNIVHITLVCDDYEYLSCYIIHKYDYSTDHSIFVDIKKKNAKEFQYSTERHHLESWHNRVIHITIEACLNFQICNQIRQFTWLYRNLELNILTLQQWLICSKSWLWIFSNWNIFVSHYDIGATFV